MSSNNSIMNRKQITNLYVKNFGNNMDESKLCQLFSVYGTITSCKIQTDNNGQSKGFGFVNFERPEMAKNAMEKLNGYELGDGKNLYVGPFQKKSERQNDLQRIQEENLNKRSNNLCLYISNLDLMVDENILEAIFTKFGKVTKTHILRNGYQSKGIGFVCFNTIEETTMALNEMNGKWILSKPIYVKMSRNNDHSQLTTSDSPQPSTPSIIPSHPPVTPMPYLNISPVFYVPTMIIPRPPNNFPMPIPPPNTRMPMIRGYPPPPTTTTHVNRQSYPYIRVKSDDDQ